ncbi:MAG: hypothetical protein A2Z03_06450 [Chloroflexi bacterium RBG_16_56_8]|nr:MAG: hypothetical protein A2Z03_06450 [Chloroflexi bacterium RBG_16_56_8]
MAVQIAPVRRQVKHWTYEEYRALPEDGNRYEVVEGELLMTAAPLIDHQRVSANLQFILETYIRANSWGTLFDAPVELYLDEKSFVEPDIVCVAQAHRGIIKKKNITGVPDLIVEILSPSTARYDRVIKMNAYARHQVPHYWIVDPEAKTLEAFEWEKGTYRLVAARAEEETFQPALFPSLTISLADLWK